MKPYLTILRPANCLMSVIAVIVGGLLVLKTFSFPLIPASITAFLIAGAGNVINDYIDIEADKINKPKRPIPSGETKPKTALAYSAILFVFGIAFSFATTPLAIAIALVNSVLLVLYARYLKNMMFLGNFIVSYLVGSTILFGSAAVVASSNAQIFTLPLLLMALSTLSNFSREIVKTLEDLEGDRLAFIKQAVRKAKARILQKFHIEKGETKFKYSQRFTIGVAVASLLLSAAISPLPYLLRLLGPSYLVVLVPTDLTFLYAAYLLAFSESKTKFTKTSKLIKVGMFLGLLAYLIGVLV